LNRKKLMFMKPWIILLVVVAGLTMLSVKVSRQSGVSALTASTEALPVANDNSQRVPVLVELFTSEGCSSCPPADAVLAKLERTQPVAGAEIIALGQHVDYWNYIGWADPFSSPLFSERQGDYGRTFNRDGVYTPQMVVDGEVEFIGSNLSKARDAIAKAALHQKASVQITRPAAAPNTAADLVAFKIRIADLPPISNNETVDLMLAVTESDLFSNVSRGENSGRRLEHGSVVRHLVTIAQVDPREAKIINAEPSVKLAPEWKRENLRAVAFAQAHRSRRVLGTGVIRLAGNPGAESGR
jgi:hypothetical protein